MTWSYEAKRVSSVDLYRDGELVATLSSEQSTHVEKELSPNKRYAYRATFRLGRWLAERGRGGGGNPSVPSKTRGANGLN